MRRRFHPGAPRSASPRSRPTRRRRQLARDRLHQAGDGVVAPLSSSGSSSMSSLALGSCAGMAPSTSCRRLARRRPGLVRHLGRARRDRLEHVEQGQQSPAPRRTSSTTNTMRVARDLNCSSNSMPLIVSGTKTGATALRCQPSALPWSARANAERGRWTTPITSSGPRQTGYQMPALPEPWPAPLERVGMVEPDDVGPRHHDAGGWRRAGRRCAPSGARAPR